MKLNVIKAGAWAAGLLACIAMGGMLLTPIWAALDTRYDSSEVVNTKITTAVEKIQTDIHDWRKADIEMWINYFDSKANRNQADDSDMVLLNALLRQREERLLTQNQPRSNP